MPASTSSRISSTVSASSDDSGSLPPPRHILNAPTKLMKAQGYGAGYAYDHDTSEGFSGQDYFPDAMERQTFYAPPERGFEHANLDHDVQAALDALAPEFRAAVVLCDIEGLSYEEISVTLGVKLGTVRSRIHRGRAQLREALAHRAPGAEESDGAVHGGYGGPVERSAVAG